VTRIAEMTGDDLEVVAFERMTPLTTMSAPIDLEQIQQGDAIVAFSRAEVMRLRTLVGEKMKVAVVYGALSPEARRSEARRFRDGEAKVLIATDAIAMGLNMPIKRVIFSALEKFDGQKIRDLTSSEIRQIAGRAGRYGISEKGEAGVLKGLNISFVANALKIQPTQALQNRLFVMPPWRAVELVSESLNITNLSEILIHIAKTLLNNDPLLLSASLETPVMISDTIHKSSLSLKIRHSYLGYPLDKRLDASLEDLKSWSRTHGQNGVVHAPQCTITNVPTTDKELMRCEDASKRLSAYLWLSLRYPKIYPFNDQAMAERQRVNILIEKALQNKALAKSCRECGARLSAHHRFPICEDCHQEKFSGY
jgi:ATP-dependent RNA helicase SUPV3L1/SUV3